MRKFIAFLIAGVMLAGVAFASVNIQSGGTDLGPTQTINFTNGTITNNGPTKVVDLATVAGNMDVSGTFASGTANAFTVGATGIIVDTSLYATTQGVGGNRTVCVSADGKIFSSATACP